jgi:hypothetical protein
LIIRWLNVGFRHFFSSDTTMGFDFIAQWNHSIMGLSSVRPHRQIR